ncbi:MAG: hypothetical protein A2169_07295 [Deltaproteobacteria bacterium RBG_13_47_9]|nr:MAG: hypothetical protein A2169_07295 [Deltaproteobacteria bacterium RBG_13_47_9]
MSGRYLTLSLLLVFIIMLLFLKNYEIWTYPLEGTSEKETMKKLEKRPESPPMMAGQRNPTSIQSYISISEKNIFSPERKEFPIFGADSTKPMVRPQVVLYGVTIAGDYKAASIVNPGRPVTKGERELMTVKIGDSVGEYKLTKILSDRIRLEAAGDTFEVLLYDPKALKRRMGVKTENRPATVTSTQPASAPSAVGALPHTPPAGGPVLASPPTSVVAPRPIAPRGPVVTPPPPATATPTFPTPDVRRGRRPVYTPSPSTPTQGMEEY